MRIPPRNKIQINVPAGATLNFNEFRRKGKRMRSYQLRATILALACLTSAGPTLAQNASTTPAAPAAPAQDVPTPPADNPTFLDGLRRVGVMAGQVVECSADADKQDQISRAMELANLIAIHFGLKAAFTFTGALGYGSGRPFDKADCSQAIDGWKQIQAKYLNK
jgi:hypothetical protein